jgi:hypothetical protein
MVTSFFAGDSDPFPCEAQQEFGHKSAVSDLQPPEKTMIWVCLKIEKTPKPNGFADHYPY